VQGLKDGDVVYYDKHAGHGITWKDTMYQVIRGRDVVLVE
jgi:co-chaperonin GroES (HSP10)